MKIVYCLHGDELATEQIAKTINEKYGTEIILGNPKARKAGVRFLESDLNRSFGKTGTLESRLSVSLRRKLVKNDPDLIIDLHQTTAKQPPCAIITDLAQLKLVAMTGFKKVIYMTPKFSSGGSLIENVPNSFSLEFHDDPKSIADTIESIVKVIEKVPTERVFELYYLEEIVKGDFDPSIKNFKKLSGFYPVFSGEVAYKGVKYLKTSKYKVEIE